MSFQPSIIFAFTAGATQTGAISLRHICEVSLRSNIDNTELSFNRETERLMTKWEYRIIEARAGKELLKRINTLGIEGWEAMSASVDSSSSLLTILLKRPKA